MNTQVIAEIGWNHMGRMELAESMIQEAAAAGANFAKFQTWSAKNLKPGPWDTDGRRQIYEQAELSREDHFTLKDLCQKNGIEFLTSCFNEKDVDLIAELSDKVKIPSTEITNIPMLKKVANKFKTIIMSTGASTIEEVCTALNYFRNNEVFLLHCVSTYPCNYDEAKLSKIKKLKNIANQHLLWEAEVKVGYSGHCYGIYDALSSLEFGAEMIEKHFTIDHNLPGRDNKFAILPAELKMLCDYIKYRPQMWEWDQKTEYLDKEKEARDVYRGRWSG